MIAHASKQPKVLAPIIDNDKIPTHTADAFFSLKSHQKNLNCNSTFSLVLNCN